MNEQTELLRRFRLYIYGKPKLARCCLTASKQESIHMQQLLNTSHVLTVYWTTSINLHLFCTKCFYLQSLKHRWNIISISVFSLISSNEPFISSSAASTTLNYVSTITDKLNSLQLLCVSCQEEEGEANCSLNLSAVFKARFLDDSIRYGI